jgi:hypothetical protein
MNKFEFLPPVDGDDLEVDPIEILRQIAADPATPATARVAACRALVAAAKRGKVAQAESDESTDDPVTRRALELLAKPSSVRPN